MASPPQKVRQKGLPLRCASVMNWPIATNSFSEYGIITVIASAPQTVTR